MSIEQVLSEIEWLTYSDDLESAWVSERIQAVLFSCREELTKLKHLVRFGELYPHLYETLCEMARKEIEGVTKLNKLIQCDEDAFILDLVSTHPTNKALKTTYRIAKSNNKIDILHINLNEAEATVMNAAITYSQSLIRNHFSC